MKKTIVLCLLVLSMIGVLAACKDEKNTTPSATPTEAATPTPTEVPTETPTPTPSPLPDVVLKDVFAEHGLKVGTCLTTTMTDNAAYSKLILQQFTSVTMENDMKPDYLFNQEKSKAIAGYYYPMPTAFLLLFQIDSQFNDMKLRQVIKIQS